MIAGFVVSLVITAALLRLCLAIYQLMKDKDTRPPAKAKVYPLSDDDMALWRQCLKIDEWKVIQNRYMRELQRERYEYFTLPRIYWAYRERQIDSENIRERTHQLNNGAASR